MRKVASIKIEPVNRLGISGPNADNHAIICDGYNGNDETYHLDYGCGGSAWSSTYTCANTYDGDWDEKGYTSDIYTRSYVYIN